MIGTALTGAVWRTYFTSRGGELLCQVGGAPFGLTGEPAIVASFATVDEARAAGERALLRDIRFATEDMRVAFPDVETLLQRCVDIRWVAPEISEGPVEPGAARAALDATQRDRD
jgi:hypothetical protein